MTDMDRQKLWDAFNGLCSAYEAGHLVKPNWWTESIEVPFPSYDACLHIAKHRVEEFKRTLEDGKTRFRWDMV